MKKLELVTTNGNIRIAEIKLSDTESDYYLVGNNLSLFCNNPFLRLSRISELSKRLEIRDWHIAGRRYTQLLDSDSDGQPDWDPDNVELYYSEKGSGGFVNVISDTSSGVRLRHPEASEENKRKLEAEIKALSSLPDGGRLKEIYDSMSNSEIYLYSRSKNTVDILNGSVTIDVIPYNSDVYTNIVDISVLTGYQVSPGISTRIDIGIQYSKNIPEETVDPDTGVVTKIEYVEKLYSKETSFMGFKYVSTDDGGIKLVNNSYVENIGTDIVIEYTNNIIRVVPKSIDIDECIISNCTVTYGKL